MELQIGLGNGVRVEHVVAAIILTAMPRRTDAAINHEMPDMDILRMKFARQRLRQTTKPEFAHGKDRRVGKALYASRRAGEEDAPRSAFQHPPRRLLRHQKGAETGHLDGGAGGCRVKLGDRAGKPRRRVVDNKIGRAGRTIQHHEKPFNILDRNRIAPVQGGACFIGNGAGLFTVAGGKHDIHAGIAAFSGQRGAEPGSGADNKG